METITIGTGSSLQKVYKLADRGRTFTAFEGRGDQEPRVRDIDLAEWLGFDRPRNIRKLVLRHKRLGNIQPLELRSTVERSSSSGKFLGSHESTEFWLDEADALFVVTKSETPKANQLTRDLIRDFLELRQTRPAEPPRPIQNWEDTFRNLAREAVLLENGALGLELLRFSLIREIPAEDNLLGFSLAKLLIELFGSAGKHSSRLQLAFSRGDTATAREMCRELRYTSALCSEIFRLVDALCPVTDTAKRAH